MLIKHNEDDVSETIIILIDEKPFVHCVWYVWT